MDILGHVLVSFTLHFSLFCDNMLIILSRQILYIVYAQSHDSFQLYIQAYIVCVGDNRILIAFKYYFKKKLIPQLMI